MQKVKTEQEKWTEGYRKLMQAVYCGLSYTCV